MSNDGISPDGKPYVRLSRVPRMGRLFSPRRINDMASQELWAGRRVRCDGPGGGTFWCDDTRYGWNCCPPGTTYVAQPNLKIQHMKLHLYCDGPCCR